MSVLDLTGRRFGQLKVLGRAPAPGKDNHSYWLCVCRCKKRVIVRGVKLVGKLQVSCGHARGDKEARRLARFEPRGHTPGAYVPATETPHPEFPLTLDLRRPAGLA